LFVSLLGLQQQGIFRVPGSQVEVNDIKNSFERGEQDWPRGAREGVSMGFRTCGAKSL
jgi:hypothetical protein